MQLPKIRRKPRAGWCSTTRCLVLLLGLMMCGLWVLHGFRQRAISVGEATAPAPSVTSITTSTTEPFRSSTKVDDVHMPSWQATTAPPKRMSSTTTSTTAPVMTTTTTTTTKRSRAPLPTASDGFPHTPDYMALLPYRDVLSQADWELGMKASLCSQKYSVADILRLGKVIAHDVQLKRVGILWLWDDPDPSVPTSSTSAGNSSTTSVSQANSAPPWETTLETIIEAIRFLRWFDVDVSVFAVSTSSPLPDRSPPPMMNDLLRRNNKTAAGKVAVALHQAHVPFLMTRSHELWGMIHQSNRSTAGQKAPSFMDWGLVKNIALSTMLERGAKERQRRHEIHPMSASNHLERIILVDRGAHHFCAGDLLRLLAIDADVVSAVTVERNLRGGGGSGGGGTVQEHHELPNPGGDVAGDASWPVDVTYRHDIFPPIDLAHLVDPMMHPHVAVSCWSNLVSLRAAPLYRGARFGVASTFDEFGRASCKSMTCGEEERTGGVSSAQVLLSQFRKLGYETIAVDTYAVTSKSLRTFAHVITSAMPHFDAAAVKGHDARLNPVWDHELESFAARYQPTTAAGEDAEVVGTLTSSSRRHFPVDVCPSDSVAPEQRMKPWPKTVDFICEIGITQCKKHQGDTTLPCVPSAMSEACLNTDDPSNRSPTSYKLMRHTDRNEWYLWDEADASSSSPLSLQVDEEQPGSPKHAMNRRLPPLAHHPERRQRGMSAKTLNITTLLALVSPLAYSEIVKLTIPEVTHLNDHPLTGTPQEMAAHMAGGKSAIVGGVKKEFKEMVDIFCRFGFGQDQEFNLELDMAVLTAQYPFSVATVMSKFDRVERLVPVVSRRWVWQEGTGTAAAAAWVAKRVFPDPQRVHANKIGTKNVSRPRPPTTTSAASTTNVSLPPPKRTIASATDRDHENSSPITGVINTTFTLQLEVKPEYRHVDRSGMYWNIPLVIHQTHAFPVVPINMQHNIELTKALNEEYDYEFWDDQRVHRFMRTSCGKDTYQAWQSLKPKAFKADLFRYCLLYVKGGIYLDMDLSLRKSISEWIYPRDEFVSAKELHVKDLIYQAILACPPGNLMMKRLLEESVSRVLQRQVGRSALYMTGPMMVYDVLKATLQRDPEVATLSPKAIEMMHRGLSKEEWKRLAHRLDAQRGTLLAAPHDDGTPLAVMDGVAGLHDIQGTEHRSPPSWSYVAFSYFHSNGARNQGFGDVRLLSYYRDWGCMYGAVYDASLPSSEIQQGGRRVLFSRKSNVEHIVAWSRYPYYRRDMTYLQRLDQVVHGGNAAKPYEKAWMHNDIFTD